MPTETPKSPPPARQSVTLQDLPAQPVHEKEAEGVKGGTAADGGSSPTGITNQQ
ncbi:MAG: hypothetical protein ABI664_08555 [bacterium]